jgi:hypothetical protein
MDMKCAHVCFEARNAGKTVQISFLIKYKSAYYIKRLMHLELMN